MQNIAKVLLVSFALAALLQGARMLELSMPDTDLWANEAKYVLTGDTRQYDFDAGYGHPAGPIIEGAIALHASGLPFATSVKFLIYILGCIFTVAIAFACYALRPETHWWLMQSVLVSIDWSYLYATPTTVLSSLLALLLFLLTWLIYERANVNIQQNVLLLSWALCAGLLVSVRADIGSVLTLSFSLYLFLTERLSFSRLAGMAAIALAVFFATDPYMWWMPLSHVLDLFAKVIFQIYYYPLKDNNSPSKILAVISLSITSMIVAGGALLRPDKRMRMLPSSLYLTLLAISAMLFPLFMIVRYESERYFLPLAFIWEAILPITLLTIAPKSKVARFLSWTPAAYSFALSCFFIWLQVAYNLPI